MIIMLIILTLFFIIISAVVGVGFEVCKDGVLWFTLVFLVWGIFLSFRIYKKYNKNKISYVSIVNAMLALLILSITFAGILYMIGIGSKVMIIIFCISLLVLLFIIIFRINDRIIYGVGNAKKNTIFNITILTINILMVSTSYAGFLHKLKLGVILSSISLLFIIVSLISILSTIDFNNFYEDESNSKEEFLKEYNSKKIKIILSVIVISITLIGSYSCFFKYGDVNSLLTSTNGEESYDSKSNIKDKASTSDQSVDKESDYTEGESVENNESFPYEGIRYNQFDNIDSIDCIEGNTANIIEAGELINDFHSKILRVNLGKSYSGSPKDYRTKILPSEGSVDISSYASKFLIFDIYNDTIGDSGSPFIALRDGQGRQIAGWCEEYGPDEYYYGNYINKGQWTTICIDLSKLMINTNSESGVWQPMNFNFSEISWIWIGYWAEGDIYIDNITFSNVIPQ